MNNTIHIIIDILITYLSYKTIGHFRHWSFYILIVIFLNVLKILKISITHCTIEKI